MNDVTNSWKNNKVLEYGSGQSTSDSKWRCEFHIIAKIELNKN